MVKNFKGKMLPENIGKIHFIGIGGIGISAIAELLHSWGFDVQGSDSSNNQNTARLSSKNIKIFIGQNANNINHASYVVKSSAVPDDNVEIIAAKSAGIKVLTRADMLAEIVRLKTTIAVAGTHGKTTTTSMITHLLETANLSPSVINGGILLNKDTNAYVGESDLLVVEADESDGTFTKLPAAVGVITNIEAEHLDYYQTFEQLFNEFKFFVENKPFFGFTVACIDCQNVVDLVSQIDNKEIITYAIDNQSADIRAENIQYLGYESIFDVVINGQKFNHSDLRISNVKLSAPGQHNILNSLAAIAVILKIDFNENNIINGLASFAGVKRRFNKLAEINGCTIIDDYAHHPTEINISLAAAKNLANSTSGKVIAVIQPHRYSRVKELMQEFTECFNNADVIYLTDIYSAGEDPLLDITSQTLATKVINNDNNKTISCLSDFNDLPDIILNSGENGDVLIFMGAGDITSHASQFVNKFHDKISNM
ncbi:MAG: UDP-N-acetylmuramate--L-alanine ligase [Pseudomonadota bacterium]